MIILNFYLIGSASVNVLDDNTYQSDAIEQRWNNELYLGFAFFNDKTTRNKDSISTKPYVRFSHGWSTPSNIGNIIIGHIDSDRDGVKDQYNNQLSSIFYGLPLTDEFFWFPRRHILNARFCLALGLRSTTYSARICVSV
jgi:outer membrane protein